MNLYNKDFYQLQQRGSKNSARNIVPIVLNLVKPKSIVDVGCGVGTWLSVFMEQGISDVLGIDGEYVDKSMLHIPNEMFLEHDLSKPLTTNRNFGLVVSLEVAEHISEDHADVFLNNLINLGKVILFSAAVPNQGGVGHYNEHWPDYWIQKFKTLNYEVLDIIRPKIWNEIENSFWYNQNILLFVEKEYLQNSEYLQGIVKRNNNFQGLSLVHPELYVRKCDEISNIYRDVFKKMYLEKQYDLVVNFTESNHPIAHFYIGRAFKDLRKYKDSIRYLEKYLLSMDTEFQLSATLHLAEVYYYLEDMKTAKVLFLKCLELTSNNHSLASDYLNKMGYLS